MKFLNKLSSTSRYYPVSSDDGELIPFRVRHDITSKIRSSCIVVLALGWMITLLLYWELSVATRRSYTPIPSEVFNRVTKVFQPDERYVGPSLEALHHWDDLAAGHDVLYVEDPEKYGLSEGITALFDHPNKPDPPLSKFYIISLMHQLHCLNMIRWNYWIAAGGSNLSTIKDAVQYSQHVDHCFEYLRQSISCGGDITIEGHSPLGDATPVTGWGAEHSCIDFERLRQFQIDQEKKYNQTWQQA